MRLHSDIKDFLTEQIRRLLPRADIYLFGSRVHDDAKGGDIDILIIGSRKLSLLEKLQLRMQFDEQFGEQKIDILSYSRGSDDPFLRLILEDAVKLNA